MQLITHQKKTYELRDLGNGFVGHVPSSVTITEGTPGLRWAKGKIPLEIWAQVVAFFQWSYEVSHSETQVRLFYNPDTDSWRVHAFPQKWGTGMTAKELSDTPGYNEQLSSLMEGGYFVFGTVHHHCAAGAFQSGTDSHDEKSVMGIHITVGNIGSAQHSIHGRVSLIIPGSGVSDPAKQAFYDAVWADWFNVPGIDPSWPVEISSALVEWTLKQPSPEDTAFPDIWRDNLIKERPLHVVTPRPAANNPLLRHWNDARANQAAGTQDWENGEYWSAGSTGYYRKDGTWCPAGASVPDALEAAAEVRAQEQEEHEKLLELVATEVESAIASKAVSLCTLHGMMTLPAHLCLDVDPLDEQVFEEVKEILEKNQIDWEDVLDLLT